MPYIRQSERELLEHGEAPTTPGQLNYLLTVLISGYMSSRGGTTYTNLNEVIGVLECAKLELYRRVAAPYEDRKRLGNGDVYGTSI
jgi:hypothetical protein